MMKNTITTLSFLIISLLSSAQGLITNLNYLKAENLPDLSKRDVVVVEYREAVNDNKRLEKKLLKAKGDDATEIKKRMAENDAVNAQIQEILISSVRNNWEHGDVSNIRSVTIAEVKEMIKTKEANNYAIVFVRSFTKSMSMYDGTGIDKIELTALCYQGMEDYGKGIDILGFPLIVSEENWAFTEADLVATTRVLNNYVSEMKTTKGKLTLAEFLESQAIKNCELKKSTTLHVQGQFLKDATYSDVKQFWPNDVEMAGDANSFEGYVSSSSDAFAVFIPTQIAEGSIGPFASQALIYTRIVVQPSSGKILGFSKTKMGEKAGELFYKKGHLEDVGSCPK
jgi:hypothetical protein